jgi:hypothetical protein
VEAGTFGLARLRAREAVRWLAPALYVAALSIAMWRDGIPAARERLLLWIVLGLLAFSITNVRGWARGVVLEWLPFALILWAYDILRGQADGLLFDPYTRPQLEGDRLLGFGTAPTVFLQEHLWHGSLDLRWWDYGAWLVYTSYFLATYLLAAALWFFARDRFRPYVATVTLLALMDFATLFERGSEYANPVAAVPSLHAAYTLLFSITLWRLVPRWVRPLLAAYPVAMAFALVYTAEHYLVDVLLGWGYTLVAVLVVEWARGRLASRRATV